MTPEIVNSLDEKTWREFVSQHPQANIFHTPEMFQVFAKAKGHQPTVWAALNADKQPQAMLLPVRITLQNKLLHSWTTRAVAYGSILSAGSDDGQEGLKSLLETYRRKMQGHILFTEFRNFTDLSSIQPVLNACHFVYEDHLDYLIDLDQPEDKLWHDISKSGRQRLRIARNKGTVIEEITDRDQITIAYQQLQSVYNRVQVPLAHISLFQAAYDILAPLEMCKVFLARVNDQYIGASFVLIYKGKILAWYSGTDRAFSAYNPGELLKWHAFIWGKKHGDHQFDFGGAGKPNQAYGPRAFKAKFGGKLVNYGRNVCVHSPLRLQISKIAYAWAQKAALFRGLLAVNSL
jgi:serine/alanine adding enzyme